MRTDTAPQSAPKTHRLSEYRPPAFVVDDVHLTFALHPTATVVTARLSLRRAQAGTPGEPLWLDGEDLELLDIAIDGEVLPVDAYAVTANGLTVAEVPDAFTLTTRVRIDPTANTKLSGLYLSSGMFCTQCEAEGFRRITFYPDRPDVLSRFSVRIEAEAAFPVLLSNGNPGERGELEGGRRFAEWSDPHPKPAYLFALVGGDLEVVEDHFTTLSGREVALRVFVQAKDTHKCAYALDALKRSMRWDEEVFGREYDLDLFMIVAVDHFNFGAMENKGLNIFNASCVLSSPETATDADFEMIESIVAHEYFHNWSGNRVTCRDWFQLCLKEGFTVFRDQEFSADQRSRAVQRIKDVRSLWRRQFPEDAGPLKHPVRPREYVAIDNFYTATVYDKGAELVRMLKTMAGEDGFRAGTDRYFDANDGTAATVEDFVGAIAAGADRDLRQFAAWYEHAGTPELIVTESYDATTNAHTLTLRQDTSTKEAGDTGPRHMPIRLALIAEEGEVAPEQVVELDETERTVVTEGLSARPVASILRGFSAPVRMTRDLSAQDRLLLAARDTDPFARWSATHELASDLGLSFAGIGDVEAPEAVATELAAALTRTIADETLEPALRAEMLRLPSTTDLARRAGVIDPDALARGYQTLREAVLAEAKPVLERLYGAMAVDAPYDPGAEQAGRRALRNEALRLLMADGEAASADRAAEQAEAATNMTDEAAATAALALSPLPQRDAALSRFHDRWQGDPLVLNKWLAWQAAYAGPGALAKIRALMDHPAFELTNPNKVRALIGVFGTENLATFHAADGSGYDFFFGVVRAMDRLNPQVASRLLTATEAWRRLEPARKALIEKALRDLGGADGLSDNLYETAHRLAGEP